MEHSKYIPKSCCFFFDFLLVTTQKQIKSQYKRIHLGFIWFSLYPIIQMIIIGFVITLFQKNISIQYFISLYIGLVIWNTFNLTIQHATTSIVANRMLIKKTLFPAEALPLSICLTNFIQICIPFALFLIYTELNGSLSIISFLYLFLSLFMLFILTTGISLLTSSLYTKTRDVMYFTQAFLQLLFYATPIIYPLHLIPKNLLFLYNFNPLTSIIGLARLAILKSDTLNITLFISNIIIILIFTLLGYKIFQNKKKNFDDWL